MVACGKSSSILVLPGLARRETDDLEANHSPSSPVSDLSVVDALERVTRPDGLPMHSAPRCATRLYLSRESFSCSGHLNEKPQGLFPYPRRSTELAIWLRTINLDASKSSRSRVPEDPAIVNPLTSKGVQRLLAQQPSHPPRPRRRTPTWMQSCIVPEQRRESGSLRHHSVRDPSQPAPPADDSCLLA
jgi:hypothetical protein